MKRIISLTFIFLMLFSLTPKASCETYVNLTDGESSFAVLGAVEEVPYDDFTDYIDLDDTDDFFEDEMYEEPDFFDPYEEIKEYDESLIYISGISHYEYDTYTVNYHDRVAVCTSPVTIEIRKDLKMFSVMPIIKLDGSYMLDEESFFLSISEDSWKYDEKYSGDILPAKKGEVVTLTKPGLYNVFAEVDYMGQWTELVIEIPSPDATYDAVYTGSKVLVDGSEVKFEAYNIDGNNYFKLRDIAYVLSGTSKQFEVEWDGANQRINLIHGVPYTSVGGELKAGDGLSKKATRGTGNISLYDRPANLKAYMINGNNYFKLRDLGRALDFNVSWDGANNCILIDTDMPYIDE